MHYNEYGGTIGGPVWIPKVYNGKQKTFFFFAYDGIRNQDPRFGTRSLPTDLERKGDFSQSYTTTVISGVRARSSRCRSTIRSRCSAMPTAPARCSPDMVIPSQPPEQGRAEHPQLCAAAEHSERRHQQRRQQLRPVLQPRRTRWPTSPCAATISGTTTTRPSPPSAGTTKTNSSGDEFHNAFTGAYQHRMARGSGIDHVWTISPTTILDLQPNLTRYEEPNNDNGVGFDAASLGFPAASPRSWPCRRSRASPASSAISASARPAASSTRLTTPAPAVLTQVKGNMTWKYGAEHWVLQQANKGIGNAGPFRFRQQQLDAPAGARRRRHRESAPRSRSFLLGLPHKQRRLPAQRGRVLVASTSKPSTFRTTGASPPG